MCFYFGFFLYFLFKCGHQKVASKISMTRLCFHPTQMDSSREYEMIAWFWGLVSASLSSFIYAFLLFCLSKVNMYHVNLNYHRIRLLNRRGPDKTNRNNELLLGLSRVFVKNIYIFKDSYLSWHTWKFRDSFSGHGRVDILQTMNVLFKLLIVSVGSPS